MNKCDGWHKEERIVGWCGFSPLTKTVYECFGTKEREECHCMGDRGKCDFYPEVREKAKKVPATIDEAISHFTMGITHDIFNEPVTSYANLAIEALRQMQEKEQNKPLMLDEMNALDHEPIYVLHTGGKWTINGWHIATASSYQNHGRCDLEIDNGNTTIDTQNYGKTWLAYHHKSKEEHHEAD